MKGPTLFFLVMVLLTSVGAVADESDQDLPAPFTLTSRQQAEVDQVLRHWAQGATGVKLFEWSFTRWEYDSVFSPTDKAKSIDQGAMKYAPPNRWMYRLDGPRAEHWTCDGRSLFEYSQRQKRFIEHRLPPTWPDQPVADGPLRFLSLVTKAILDGPLQSLLFVTEVQKLKDRYFLRVITPAEANDQVWLQAYPRFKQDAALFQRAELILATGDKQPYALQIHHRNAKARTVFLLRRIETDETWPADAFMPGLFSD